MKFVCQQCEKDKLWGQNSIKEYCKKNGRLEHETLGVVGDKLSDVHIKGKIFDPTMTC